MTSDLDLSTTWIVVPAYQEADAIGTTVRDLREVFRHVIVVDDCSRDDTSALARAAGAQTCRHPINLGQGAALATGIAYALAEGAEEIVTFDADGQHAVADAVALVAARRRAEVDVVLGSRFRGGTTGAPALRLAVLRLAVVFTRLTTGLAVTDTHNGLRVIGADAARRMTIRQNRMAHASEILHEIARHRLSYVEHPVTIRYTDYSRTKGQRLTGLMAILSDLLLDRIAR